jgi:hypothetical protein
MSDYLLEDRGQQSEYPGWDAHGWKNPILNPGVADLGSSSAFYCLLLNPSVICRGLDAKFMKSQSPPLHLMETQATEAQ